MPDEAEHCFEALIYGHGPESRCKPDWYCHSLPPPPYDLHLDGDDRFFGDVCGHALVGGAYIWVSTEHSGTYSFSTVARSWSKLVNWQMPFGGRAEYVPELGVSLGFSSQDNMLCACDLAGVEIPRPPKVLGKWEDVVQGKEWIPMTSELVPLGSGKVFIAKFFQVREKGYNDYGYGNSDCFAVFTGVELENSGGQLRMRKHKSMRYQRVWIATPLNP
ncbi:hypothetical protein EJB05_56861, partial [Eragrostis curvula]